MEKTPRKSLTRSRRSKRRNAAATGIPETAHPQCSANLDFAKRMAGTLPEAIRSKDLEVLNPGLEFFFADLRAARRESNQRHGAIIAVGALMRFIVLFKTPLSELLHVPAQVLHEALLSLDDNIVKTSLEPTKKRGRSRSSIAREALKGHVAAAAQRLLQAGMSTTGAHRLIAKELKKLGVKPERGSGDLTATTVGHWCDNVAEDVTRTGGAAHIYDSIFTEDEVKRFKALPSDQARKALALTSLAGFVREVVSAKPS
jgi:hypothetical protein